MKIYSKQSGFSAVEALIVIVVVGLIGFIGYSVYNSNHTKTTNNAVSTTSSTTTSTAKANDVATAPNISSTADLDKASATLDQTDPATSNSTDSSQLDTQLASF